MCKIRITIVLTSFFRAGDRWGLNKLIHWKHLKHYPKWKWSERCSDLLLLPLSLELYLHQCSFFFTFWQFCDSPLFPLLLFLCFDFYNWAFQVISGSDRSDRVLILGKRTVTKPGYFGAYNSKGSASRKWARSIQSRWRNTRMALRFMRVRCLWLLLWIEI